MTEILTDKRMPNVAQTLTVMERSLKLHMPRPGLQSH
jgi:hypothetical protein